MIPAVVGLGAWVAKGAALLAVSKLVSAFSTPEPLKAIPTPSAPIQPLAPVSQKPLLGSFLAWPRRSIVFQYDNLGQLVGVDLNSTPQASYQFDLAGNLQSLTVGNTTTTFDHNSLNQRVEAGTTYDAKGQITAVDGKTFEWDEEGRCTAIVNGTNRSEFAYDGMGRRVKITELSNGTVTSKKLYFWIGGTIVCERDGLQVDFPISKRFFGQGEVRGTDKLYYTRDHLGSIRQVVDATGAVRADYRYTTYGERIKASGDLDVDWGYGQLWHHEPSGLYLATHRIYDSTRGRWLSRDPLGEGTDRTLYSYVFNSPINFTDPEGLQLTIPVPLLVRLGQLGRQALASLEALEAEGALLPSAGAAAAANSDSMSFPNEYGSDRFERLRVKSERNNPDSEAPPAQKCPQKRTTPGKDSVSDRLDKACTKSEIRPIST